MSKACTIFSHFTELGKVHARLLELFGAEALETEGSPQDWTRISVTRRSLLRKSTLTLQALRHEGPDSELADMVRKMHHVFQAIPAEDPAIQQKLLTRIRTLRLGIGVVADRRLDDWEQAIFAAARELDGIVFWGGSEMLNAKGHVILDFNGRCRVEDLEVVVEAGLLDGEQVHSAEAVARKQRSEALLKARKVPLNPNLPPIADSQHAVVRTSPEIADRALALCLVALKGEGLKPAILDQVARQFEILPLLSPAESVFFPDPEPDPQALANFAWRYESLQVLLWALGYLPELAFPDAICDVQSVVGVIREAGSRKALRDNARLRPIDEILDQTDLVYRQHWACVDARLRGAPAPAHLLRGVVYERHYALNWLRAYQHSEWDAVSTDT